jgi:feruloyl-CoA synthase
MGESNYKNVMFGSRSTAKQVLEDGSVLYFLHEDLHAYPMHLTEKLDYYALNTPDRIFIARKNDQNQWLTLTYADTLSRVKHIAQYLLNFHWSPQDTIVILSGNSLEHALLALAALYVGIPYAPISPAYSLISRDLHKLNQCLSLMTPKLAFIQESTSFQRSIDHLQSHFPDCIIVTGDKGKYISFSEMTDTVLTDQVFMAHQQLNASTIAKVLFTSGSTGQPKGVINTHGMWCANLQQITQAMPFMQEEPPVFIDWLPWNHTFGGNHNFGLTLYHGGTLYIDDGKPTNTGIGITVDNLREIAPTAYFNVPKGFEMLVSYLEQDKPLRDTFFSRLQMIFYAGASLSQPVWNKLEELSVQAVGYKIPIITGLGCTESGPSAMFANWPGAYSGLLGVPVAGMKVKLIKDGDKWEARYKAPNITPGYWRDPVATEKAFDESGYYKTGDAVKFVSDDPDDGLLFDGRIAEDFKLSTGTWVNVGILKASILSSGSPIIQDVVLTGLDRDYIGAILFLHADACLKLVGQSASISRSDLFSHSQVISFLDRWLSEFNATSTGSATYIKKYLVAHEPPSLEKGEITDKGSINQRAVLQHRADLVNKIYSEYGN